jgi:hypothetical protein
VLLRGPDVGGREPLTLALLELLARGQYDLRWEARPGADGKSEPWLGWTGAPVELHGRSLQAVAALHSGLRPARQGRPVRELVGRVKERYGSLDAYVKAEILGPLVERGYYARETARLAGLVPRTRHVLTAEGAAARRELEARMALVVRRLRARRQPWAALESAFTTPQQGVPVALVGVAVGQPPPLDGLPAVEQAPGAGEEPRDRQGVEVAEWIEALFRFRVWDTVAGDRISLDTAVFEGDGGGGGGGGGDGGDGDGGGDGGE